VAAASSDAVLLLGPLYHLPDPADRATVLAEARRVLRPGGVAVVAAMSRWGRVFVRAAAAEIADPACHEHTLTSMRFGYVAGPDPWDTTVYLHDVHELELELEAAGFLDVRVVGVEGPLGAWARRDPSLNSKAIEVARVAETAMAEASIHLLAVATKPSSPAAATP
jgi:SAM-dependent methyltransferase